MCVYQITVRTIVLFYLKELVQIMHSIKGHKGWALSLFQCLFFYNLTNESQIRALNVMG